MMFNRFLMPALFLFTVQAFAKEGFSSSSLQNNFASLWENTFFLKFSNGNLAQDHEATTSLVQKLETEDGTYLGLITNKHAIAPVPEYKLIIYKNIFQFKNGDSKPILPYQENFGNIISMKIEVSPNRDLALILIKVSAQDGQSLRAIPLSSSCNLSKATPMLTIGFPSTELRAKDPKDFYDEEVWKRKRWSEGVYVGNEYEMPKGPVVGTTVDALPGNSGGPVLNSKGEIVGIMSGGIDRKYQGSEKTNQLNPHSYMVDCQSTRNFIEKSWQEFLKNQQISQGLTLKAKPMSHSTTGKPSPK